MALAAISMHSVCVDTKVAGLQRNETDLINYARHAACLESRRSPLGLLVLSVSSDAIKRYGNKSGSRSQVSMQAWSVTPNIAFSWAFSRRANLFRGRDTVKMQGLVFAFSLFF